MPEETYLEIDEPSDWEIIETILKRKKQQKVEKRQIKMFVTDCDGCLTD
jgi:N-acylneuraminate cytidylyltransferase